METQIKTLISEAAREIAFGCFRKVVGQFNSTKADQIAESYTHKIIEAAAPCKNKMEELEYEIKQCKLGYNDIQDERIRLADRIIELESTSIQFNNLPKWNKILKILWT